MSISVTQISGIGPSAARALRAKGFGSVEKIAASDVVSLSEVVGFGPIRAKATIAAAKKLTVETMKPAKVAKRKVKKTISKPKPKKKAIKPKSKKKNNKAKSEKKKKNKAKSKSKKKSKKKGKKKK
jgi:hypothetical protein